MGCSYQKQTPEGLPSKQGKISIFFFFHLYNIAKENICDGKTLSRVSRGGELSASPWKEKNTSGRE